MRRDEKRRDDISIKQTMVACIARNCWPLATILCAVENPASKHTYMKKRKEEEDGKHNCLANIG